MIKYHRGTEASQFRDKIEIYYKDGDTCVVDVPTYMNGCKVFPCGSGNNVTVSGKLAQELNNMASTALEVEHLTPSSFRELRVKFERLIKSNTATFYDWKSAVAWACGELDMSSNLLKCMYPTTDDYLGIMEFRNLGK